MIKWLYVFTVLFSFSANAQIAEINGSSENWIGKQIRLIAEKDQISNTYAYIDSDTIASDGSFKLEVNTTEISLYWLAVNRFKAPIWISPGAKYEISIIPKPENILVKTWQNGSFDYAFSSLDSTDINYQLAEFDSKFYEFYLDNSQYIGSHILKSKVKEYEKSLSINPNSTSYADVYKTYTLAEMKLSSGFKKTELFETYLKDRPILMQNVAYYHFFDLFYADYFQSFDSRFGGATMSNRMKMGLGVDSLFMLVSQDPFIENEALRQVVILNSVSKVYTNRAYPSKTLIRIVEFISSNPKSPEIAEISNRLLVKMKKPLIGTEINTLSDSWNPDWEIHTDTLPTIVMVSYEESTSSEKEALILKSLAEKYQKVVRFAEFQIGSSSKTQSQPWPVYYPNNDLAFLEDFKVYSFPHFIWIDGNNTIRESGIEKPSDGLESRLFKLQSQFDERNKIKVGQ